MTVLRTASPRGWVNRTWPFILSDHGSSNAESLAVAIASSKDSTFDEPWSLKMNGQVLFTQPRGEAVRATINHLIHHRGQLTVYLRLLDVPIPSIYGPTADEKWG